MPKANNTIHVKAIPGEAYCYEVESWEKPTQPHRVQLLDYQGNGACSCTDCPTRCIPNFKKNGGKFVEYWNRKTGRPNPLRTRCKHIVAAHVKFLNDHLREQAGKADREEARHQR